MFSVSQLSVVATAITFACFLTTLVTLSGAGVFTTVKIHSSRRKKQNLKNSKTKTAQKEKTKTKINTKTNTKTNTQTKTAQATTTKQPTKNVQPTKTIVDKTDLIGERNVSENDLKENSKYSWAYRINLNSKRGTERDIVCAWKTNDNDSIVKSLERDFNLCRSYFVGSDLSTVQVEAKYLTENGVAETTDKSYNVDNILTVKSFEKDIKELLSNMSLTQNKKIDEEELEL